MRVLQLALTLLLAFGSLLANDGFLGHVLASREELAFYLLSIPEVQEHLKLNNGDRIFLSDLARKGPQDFEESAAILMTAQNEKLKPPERNAIISRAWEVTALAKMNLLKQKVGADAWRRLEQLILRTEGLRRFCENDVLVERLKLTDSQKVGVSIACSQWRQKRLDAARQWGKLYVSGIRGTETEAERVNQIKLAKKNLRQIEAEFNEAIEMILNASQRVQWSEMVGENSDLTSEDESLILIY
jgi:hypothetical protein